MTTMIDGRGDGYGQRNGRGYGYGSTLHKGSGFITGDGIGCGSGYGMDTYLGDTYSFGRRYGNHIESESVDHYD